MSLPKQVHNYLLQHREIDLDNPRVQVVPVNDNYTDWILQVSLALNADDFAVMNIMMLLEAVEAINVITDYPESDYVEYVEVKDG